LFDAEIDRAVELRLGRQKALTADPSPQLWAILDEAAVRRVVGGPKVARAQLAHLIEMSLGCGHQPTMRTHHTV
jgi:hypothetical protein